MRCERVDQLLSYYLDGDLSGRLNRQVSDHLDECERCRLQLAAQQRAHRALAAGARPISIDLWADFSRRLQAQAPPPSPWRALWQPGLAAMVATAAVALLVLSARPPSPIEATFPLGRLTPIARRPTPARDLLSQPRRPEMLHHSQLVADRPDRPHSARISVDPLQNRSHPRHQHGRLAYSTSSGSGSTNRRHAPLRPSSGRMILALAPERESALFGSSAHEIQAVKADTEGLQRESMGVSPTQAAAGATAHTVSSPGRRHAAAGNPFVVAEALASAEQDEASKQVGGEFLRLAREVARVGGEPAAGTRPAASVDGNDTPAAPDRAASTSTGT